MQAVGARTRRNSQGSNSTVPCSASRPHASPGQPSHLPLSAGSLWCSFFLWPQSARKTKPRFRRATRLDHWIWALLRGSQPNRAAQGKRGKRGQGNMHLGSRPGEAREVKWESLGKRNKACCLPTTAELPWGFFMSPGRGTRANL